MAPLFILFAQAGFSQDNDYADAIRVAEAWLDAQKDFELLPGISAAIIKDQQLVWSGAHGMANPAKGVSATPETIYSICSISKLFTSIAIMKLYDEGKLRLDDKVGDLLPWYDLDQQFEYSGPITVRNLLTHSAGLPREANFPYWSDPEQNFPSIEAIRSDLKKQETLYPSSTYFQYSNLGLTLLGEIVSKVSGISYDQYVRANIIEPLGLSDTRPVLPESLHGTKLAIGHGALKRDMTRTPREIFQANGIQAAAGFSSNVVDLGKLASWQFRLRDGNSAEILQASTLKNMHNVHWTDPDWDTTWGLGFAVRKGSDGKTWIGHGGYCPGYQTTIQLEPKSKMAYSVMINANGVSPVKYARGLHAIIQKKAPKVNNAGQSTDKSLNEYIGIYSRKDRETFLSSWNNHIVTMPLPTNSPADNMTFYKHIEGDTFRRIRDDGELGETMVFERNNKNEVIRVVTHHQFLFDKVK